MIQSLRRPGIESALLIIKRIVIIAVFLVIGFIGYRYLLNRSSDEDRSLLITLLAFWLFTAYFALPRLHRFLAKIYLPDYFIGRVKTSDGLLGDPVNLAFIGSEAQLIMALEAAEWSRADELSFKSSVNMVRATVLHKSYPEAPVSSLFLFGRQQDFAYQHEVDGNPAKRHHVRFWKVPKGWKLPGGFEADWLAAGTYDKSVGLSLFTLQVTHKIEENTDEERDYIIATLKQAKAIKKLDVVIDYSSGYHHRNGGGDAIKTDGAMPFVTLAD